MLVSLLRAVPGYPLGKTFNLVDGNLVAGDTRAPSVACGTVVEFSTAADLGRFVDGYGHQPWCLLYSTPAKSGVLDFTMTPKETAQDTRCAVRAQIAASPALFPVVTRTKSALQYRPGADGHVFFAVDYDPGPSRLSEHEVIDQLAQAHPGFAHAPVMVADSASGFIYVDGDMRRGAGGLRLIFDAEARNLDPQLGLKEFATRIHSRLILLGHFWPAITDNGVLQLKTAVDLALFNITQPDFLGGVVLLNDRIVRRRPACRIFNEGAPRLRVDEIPPLTPEEMAFLAVIKAGVRRNLSGEIEQTRSVWVETNVKRSLVSLKNSKTEQELRTQFTRLAAFDGELKVLPLDLAIHFDDIGWRTGHEIAADPQSWHGKTCSAPLEPYYRSTDGRPSRYKAKVIVDGTDITVLDFSHGITCRYRFAGESILNKWLDRVDEEGAHDQFAQLVETSLIEAPEPGVHANLPEPIPEVPVCQFDAEAADSLNRMSSTAIAGLPLQRHIGERWLRERRLLVGVPDIKAALSAKQWIKEVLGKDARVMIMTSRAATHARLRESFGHDVFEYWGPTGEVLGIDDEICAQQEKVRALHMTGLSTISSRSCISIPHPGASPILCPSYGSCGHIARGKAQKHARVVIMLAGQLVGERNPLMGGDGEPAYALLLDLAERPVASQLSTPIGLWESTPALAALLPSIRAGAVFGRRPEGHAELEADFTQSWRLDRIMPTTPVVEAHAIAEEYRKSVVKPYLAACKKVGKYAGTPLELMDAICSWFSGSAIIKVRGDVVDVFTHRPWRRLDGTPALFAAASVGRSVPMLDSLSTIRVGEEAIVPSVTRSGGCSLPARVVQVGGHRLGYSLHKAAKSHAADGIFMKKEIRDFGALVSLTVQRVGPGVLLTADTEATFAMLEAHDIQGCRVINIYDCNASLLLGQPLRREIRWAFVLGFRRVCMQEILARVVALPPMQWQNILGEDMADGLRQVTSRYMMRDGSTIPAPDWMAEKSKTRLGSTNPDLDMTLMTMVSESVEYLSSALAELETEDGLPRTLAVMSDHPMAIDRPNPEGRILLDDLARWADVMPSAGFVWTRDGTCKTITEAAARMGVGRTVASKEMSNHARHESAVRYWLEPLGDDVDAWIQTFTGD